MQSWSEYHRTLVIVSQLWFRGWFGAVKLQDITWANVDSNLCRRITSLGHSELIEYFVSQFCHILSAQTLRDDQIRCWSLKVQLKHTLLNRFNLEHTHALICYFTNWRKVSFAKILTNNQHGLRLQAFLKTLAMLKQNIGDTAHDFTNIKLTRNMSKQIQLELLSSTYILLK